MTASTLNSPPTADLEPARIYRLSAPNCPTSAQVMRELVVALLVTTKLDALVADARLCVSEIVTNLVVYTNSAVVRVEVSIWPDRVIVSVRDSDPTGCPCPRQPCADDERGRGLLLVQRLAHDWGVTWIGGLVPTGKQVWFELRTPTAGPGATTAAPLPSTCAG